MVMTAWPSARKAGIRQLCTGSPSISTVHAPQSPASQPFLTPKCPSSRKKVRRHCPARGLSENALPLISKIMVAPGPAIRREFLRQDAASCGCVRPACREGRRDRACRGCGVRVLPAVPWLVGSWQRTIEWDAWSMPSPSGSQRLRHRCCRSAEPPNARPASTKSGETLSAASVLPAGYRFAAADRPGRPFEIGEIDQPRQMDLGLREQPGSARQPSIACRPNGQLRPCPGVSDLGDGIQIHGYAKTFNEMHLPVRSPARPTPTVRWIGLVFELQGQVRQRSFRHLTLSEMPQAMDRNQAIWIKDPLGILADGAERGIVVKDGGIVELVPRGSQPTISATSFEAGDHVVLPGLINTHHHFYQTLTRALPAALDRELFPWLQALYPVWARITPEALELGVTLAMSELLLSGCTTTTDHHYVFPPAL